MVFNKHNELVEVNDFGTIFIGLDKITNSEALETMLDSAVADGPVFTAPDNWNWSQIARAIGAFKSANQARKNGWDGSPEDGFNSRSVKINRLKGEILVVVATDESVWSK